MVSIEEIEALESDAMHYIAQTDRAVAHLERILSQQEMGLLNSEISQLRDVVNSLGYKIQSYVVEERRKIYDEIDQQKEKQP